jgi:hypothetical protein
MSSPSAAAPPEVVAAARAAGFSGEVLSTPDAARRARLSPRALLARQRRAAEAGRGRPAGFADPHRRADGRPVVLWFPVEHLDAMAAERPAPAPLDAAVVLGSSDVEHEFELELERLRGQLATSQAVAAAAEARAEAAEAEVARLRAALVALASTNA